MMDGAGQGSKLQRRVRRYLASGLPARLGLLSVAVLSACASYRPAPLPDAARLRTADAEPTAATWTVAEIVDRTLRDNPDLQALRVGKRLALAQETAAGLLPDPSFNGAVLPLVAGPGTTLAWNAALSEDLHALVTLKARWMEPGPRPCRWTPRSSGRNGGRPLRRDFWPYN